MRVLTECVAATSVVATLGLLCWAAWSDVAVRLIPNAACVSVAVFGLVHRATAGLEAVLLSSGVALGVFVLLVVMHARGLLGGGDVKLMAAVVRRSRASTCFRSGPRHRAPRPMRCSA